LRSAIISPDALVPPEMLMAATRQSSWLLLGLALLTAGTVVAIVQSGVAKVQDAADRSH
jgi:hypothetical protein